MHVDPSQRKTETPHSGTASPLALAALLAGNVALATGPLFVRLADTGPVAAGFWRIALALPLLALMAWGSGARPRRLPPMLWVGLVLGGVAFAADLGSWHLGILRTKLANATLFGNAASFIFPVYGFLVARAWPTRMQAAALLMALAGGALLMGRSYQMDPRNLVGDLLCLAAGLLYAVYFIALSRVRAAMAPLPALTLSSLASLVPLLVFALALGERVVPGQWWPLLGLALMSQVIGQGCMIYALGALSPLVVGIALLTQPIVAGAIGWIGYGEALTAGDWVGVALVAAALVLVRRGGDAAPVARNGEEAQERAS